MDDSGTEWITSADLQQPFVSKNVANLNLYPGCFCVVLGLLLRSGRQLHKDNIERCPSLPIPYFRRIAPFRSVPQVKHKDQQL